MTALEQSDPETGTIIGWMLSSPVLAWHLQQIAADGLGGTDGDQELVCTVVDLLRPDRSELWADVLKAAGSRAPVADATWKGLDPGWMDRIDWRLVRQALAEYPTRRA